jgi:hypothetical protein
MLLLPLLMLSHYSCTVKFLDTKKTSKSAQRKRVVYALLFVVV